MRFRALALIVRLAVMLTQSHSPSVLLGEDDLGQRRAHKRRQSVVGVNDGRLAILRIDGHLEQIEQITRTRGARDAAGADSAGVVGFLADMPPSNMSRISAILPAIVGFCTSNPIKAAARMSVVSLSWGM